MPTLADIKNRVRQILDDENGDRFNDTMLDHAIRQALTRLDEKLPILRTLELQVSEAGRDLTLTGLNHPSFIVKVTVLPPGETGERELKTGFSYSLQGETGKLHFSGTTLPCVGDTLQIVYASQNTLAGLDGALETSVPDAAVAALETGSASFACLLRAASLAEAYGARAGESARLVEQSRLWQQVSEESLAKLKTFQEFAYPGGFVLDQWDERGG